MPFAVELFADSSAGVTPFFQALPPFQLVSSVLKALPSCTSLTFFFWFPVELNAVIAENDRYCGCSMF